MRRIFYLAAAAVCVIVFVGVGVHATIYAPEREIGAPVAVERVSAETLASPKLSTRLYIPAIHVDAAVEARGLTTGNRMATPAYFTDVAWYKYGPLPGDPGTAVIYGHLDNGLGLDGAFKDLHEVNVGDTVQIETKEGKILTFKVDDLETYPYQGVPDLTAINNDGRSHVALVTCAGHWLKDPSLGWTYDHRLVVYATLIS